MIDSFSPQWLAQLDAIVPVQGKQTYLLIDGVFLDDTLSFVRRWPLPVEPQNALFYERANNDADVLTASPWLLPYLPDSEPARKLLAQFNALPAVICIHAADALPTLLSRLKRWTVVSCGDMQFNFRFTDTRRLPAIHRALTPTQKASLFGHHDQWAFMSRHGQWEALQTLDASHGNESQLIAASPWDELKAPELNDDQFAALLNDSEPDEVIAAVWGDLPEGCATRTVSRPSEIHHQAVHALKQADRLGVTNTPDRMSICRWVLQQRATERLTLLQNAHQWIPDLPVDEALQSLEAASHLPSRYA